MGFDDPSWLRTYAGTVFDRRDGALTIAFSGNAAHAVLFDTTANRNVRLEGTLFDDGRILLKSANHTAERQYQLDGRFIENDPRGRFRSNKLNCEVLTGTIAVARTVQSGTFVLGLEHAYSGDIDRRYQAIGAKNDDLVDQKATQFVTAVKNRDKATVARLVGFPVRVNARSGHKLIKGPEQLIAEYDELFRPEYSKAVAMARPYHLFVSNKDERAVLGGGLVLFGPDGDVVAIMNWAN